MPTQGGRGIRSAGRGSVIVHTAMTSSCPQAARATSFSQCELPSKQEDIRRRISCYLYMHNSSKWYHVRLKGYQITKILRLIQEVVRIKVKYSTKTLLGLWEGNHWWLIESLKIIRTFLTQYVFYIWMKNIITSPIVAKWPLMKSLF